MYLVFGVLFLSSILIGNAMYSTNQIFVLAEEKNEAEVEVDIEQENKCKKDSECENQNELDNKLTVKKTVLSENEGKENKIGFMYVTNY
ncbi:MAG: hypothetical protein DA328_08740, partial [Nitrososphaeraceae archaeon]|nr:hypothetical protein [Nitrososphaeraceae archaeon]